MGKLPIVREGERVGEAETARERLYMRVSVRTAARRGIWRAWAVGDAGEIRIGTLEPVNGEQAISRRFSRQELSKAGELLRVELRRAESGEVPRDGAEARPGNAKAGTEARPKEADTKERPQEEGAETRPGQSQAKERPQEENAKARPGQTQAETRRGRTEARPEAWRRSAQGQRLFRNARFQRQLRNVRDALTRSDGERRRVALVRDENAPFPLPELFCLASAVRIGARDYWVFSFDRQEWPVL